MKQAIRPIRLHKVRQNNLKGISVEFPNRKLTVITGVSGSGKSSLAFDTLYAEGQRRYVESLSTYTRQFLEKMPRPDVESVENIPPAIALEQKNHVSSSRSTVGTQTEIVDYLRLLYAKIGESFCLDCGGIVQRSDKEAILNWATRWLPGRKALITAPLLSEATKSSKSSKSRKVAAEATGSLFRILREQGFHRILWLRKQGTLAQTLDLEEQDEPGFPKIPRTALTSGELFVIIDRIRLTKDDVDKQTESRLLDSIEQSLSIAKGHVLFLDLETNEQKRFTPLFACQNCGRAHELPEPSLLSFNSPLGACPRCSGFGYTLELDESRVVPDPSKTIKNGAIDPLSKPSNSDWQQDMFRFAERHGISIGKRYRELTAAEKTLLWSGDPNDKTFPGILACFEELKRWKYKLHIRVFVRRYQTQVLCPDCGGSRLKKEAQAVKVGKQSITQTLDMTVTECLSWLDGLVLKVNERSISQDILNQVKRRLLFLDEVGVGYLTLSRRTKTLSGGEFQRINLATQLGNGLCGTLYVLDEPSIGLHAADTERLIKILHRLRDQGNTIVVVEHDLEVMKCADNLIELGPAAGRHGGEIIAQGSVADLIAAAGSISGKYLAKVFAVGRIHKERPISEKRLRLTGCQENNLKGISVEFPLERFVVVSGVSGSGKSTLVHSTLFKVLSRLYYRTPELPGRFERLYGAEHLGGVVLLDQTSIGKNSRSNPVTYLKAWDEVRRIYANQVMSLRRGYTPQHFSFNVDGGRCSTCRGEGEIELDMHFMAAIKLPCEDCQGKRFKKDLLEITYRGKNIHQLLHSTIDEAFELFRDNPILQRKLGILRSVGLGYLEVGQSAPTLSGGESQRLKIASVLDERPGNGILYIFDEPTTGLHSEDIKNLLNVLHDLVDTNNTVLVIEHNLDVIAQADWIIDLGPCGGPSGGNLVATGTPREITETPSSLTGAMLKAQGYKFRNLEP